MNTNLVLLVSRVFLSTIFIVAGLMKFGDISGTAAYISSTGLPLSTLLAIAAGTFETLAGIALLVGFQTPLAAYLLALFCLVTGILFHFVPSDQMQITMFLKNVTIAGGLLALAKAGSGGIAIDAFNGMTTTAHRRT